MQVKINVDKPYLIHIKEVKNLEFNSKIAIITSNNIPQNLINFKALDIHKIIIDDSEKNKNFDCVIKLLDRLFELKFDRNSTLIALGGGVISDIVGFVASIYMRGIKFVNIPTTLLSMVDASVGGKTGIDNKFGKNLIGSFYQPSEVFCDIRFLQTLNKDEFNNAFSEIIKLALSLDKKFYDYLMGDEIDISYIIKRSVELKAMVVSSDERECGFRRVLNFGHTFAHGIEIISDFEIPHSKAVAMGILMALKMAKFYGICSLDAYNKAVEILKKFDIFYEYSVVDEYEFLNSMKLDKKTINSKINFILISDIGKFLIKDDFSDTQIIEFLRLCR